MKELTSIEISRMHGGLSLFVWTLERLGGGLFKVFPSYVPRPQVREDL